MFYWFIARVWSYDKSFLQIILIMVEFLWNRQKKKSAVKVPVKSAKNDDDAAGKENKNEANEMKLSLVKMKKLKRIKITLWKTCVIKKA